MADTKKGFTAGAALGLGVAIAAAAGMGVQWPSAMAATTVAAASSVPPGAPLSFADIFEKVSPAVVSIEVTSHLSAKQLQSLQGEQELPFPFNLPQGRGGSRGRTPAPRGQAPRGTPPSPANPDGEGAPKGPELQASGSGFFITDTGYVVTNNHVIENADSIKIVLQDKRELVAKVICKDEGTDLAVLKVEGANFPFVSFENGAKPRVGDWVIAVGNPFNLGGTATAGIISAYGRNLNDSSSQFVDYLQIDAPINRGNSGGPTFDVYGRVVGVNSAIYSPSGGSVGIGFAIPADIADRITKQLIAGGKITRGYLGVTVQSVSPELAESLGLKATKGALVGDVVPGGPAAKGGVQQGDVITGVNGQAVASNSELTRQVALAKVGETIKLKALRNGKPITLEVKSGVRPSESQLSLNDTTGDDESGGGDAGKPDAARPPVLGLSLAPLTPGLRARFALPEAIKGAVVTGVKDDADAAKKGLHAGDVIIRAGDRAVSKPEDVSAAVADWKKQGLSSIFLMVERDGRAVGVPVKMDDAKQPK